MQERGYHTRHWLDIGMSARTLAKSVMMMQRRSKQIRSAEAKQKHSAVSIGGEMARGSRHAVVAAAYLLLCEKEHRQALGAKSERNALVRSAGERRRSSRAAMWAGGDGWMAARRFSHFGQEPMNRRRGRGRAGVFGGGPSIFSYGQNQRIWADGHLIPRVILLFFGTKFRAPRAVDACSTGARGAIKNVPPRVAV